MISYEEAQRRHMDAIERRLQQRDLPAGPLRDIVRYHLATGGKRIRALLPVWVCHNLGGDPESAIELGVGLELLHNATLVHDDLQDGDTLRRGHPTVWSRWGSAQAINAGDALIFEGLTQITHAPAGPRIMSRVLGALARLVEGQALELQLQSPAPEAPAPTVANWETMARGKTGALLGACLCAGAAAADASDALLREAMEYGDELGALFQAQDDLLDLTGDKGRERRGSDLLEGKRSLPVALAYRQASPAATAPLRHLLGLEREQRTWPMVDRALAALDACGALEWTAAWLRERGRAAAHHPFARFVPGLAELFLTPVAAALAAKTA